MRIINFGSLNIDKVYQVEQFIRPGQTITEKDCTEAAGGFGGIQHCLIPAPKHVIIDRDKDDNEYYTRLFAKEQSYRSMLRILGY